VIEIPSILPISPSSGSEWQSFGFSVGDRTRALRIAAVKKGVGQHPNNRQQQASNQSCRVPQSVEGCGSEIPTPKSAIADGFSTPAKEIPLGPLLRPYVLLLSLKLRKQQLQSH